MTKKGTKINPSTKFTQNLLILQAVDPGFMADLDSLKDGTPAEGIESIKQIIELEGQLKLAISKLRIKYNLSPGYQPYLEDLLDLPAGVKNAVFHYKQEDLPEHLRPFGIKNPNNPKEYLAVLAIDPETRPEDIQKYWKEIKNFAGIYDKRLRREKPKSCSFPRLQRDLEIYALKSKGMTALEIAKAMNKKYQYPVLGYPEINLIIKRVRDKAKKIIGQAS